MFRIISRRDIDDALESNTRQYLVGNLSRPQHLQHFSSQSVEIGISSYDTHRSEDPHFHTEAIEFQFVLSGWTRYMDIDSREEWDFKRGDFYLIEPGTKYVQKSKPGTTIIFVKVPSVNDKQAIEIGTELQAWMDDQLRTTRTDYHSVPDSPRANSIKPAAAVAVIQDDSVLMVQRADSRKWTLPGGTLEFGESLPECAVREMEEETGLAVEIVDIVGTYTNPDIKIAYSDGEVRQEFTVVFLAHARNQFVKIDSESLSYRWIPMSETDSLQMASSQRLRLDDLKVYLATGQKKIG